MFRGNVKSTGYTLHSPISPSLPLPCVTVCHQVSTELYCKLGASVQSITGSRGVHISGSNVGYTMFRGIVKSTGYPLHSPVAPSLPHPCVAVCHQVSSELYSKSGASVQSTTGSRGVHISGSNVGYTMFRGSVKTRVKATHCIRQFPLHFPSRASTCDITFQLESTSFFFTLSRKRHDCRKKKIFKFEL